MLVNVACTVHCAFLGTVYWQGHVGSHRRGRLRNTVPIRQAAPAVLFASPNLQSRHFCRNTWTARGPECKLFRDVLRVIFFKDSLIPALSGDLAPFSCSWPCPSACVATLSWPFLGRGIPPHASFFPWLIKRGSYCGGNSNLENREIVPLNSSPLSTLEPAIAELPPSHSFDSLDPRLSSHLQHSFAPLAMLAQTRQ